MNRTLLAAALLASLPAFAAEAAKPAAAAPAAAPAATPTATPAPAPASPFATEDDKAAYSIGYLSGKAHSQHLEKLNVDAFVTGFRDAYGKKEPAITEAEMRTTLEAFKQRMNAEAEAKAKLEAAENKKKGAAFLTANAKKKGVKSTKSGLQYEALTQGKGPRPKASDVVKVHYTGTLIDGSVFDSSVARGEPATFQLDQVIAGWTEALQLMPVGSKYRIALPPELGYGDQANGPIPANAVLVFEVELLGIEPPAPADALPVTPPPAP